MRAFSAPLAAAGALLVAGAVVAFSSAGCKTRSFNSDARAKSTGADAGTGAGARAGEKKATIDFPAEPRFLNAHAVCRRFDEVNAQRVVDECLKIVGEVQAFTAHGMNVCNGLITGPAGSDPRVGPVPTIANHVLDCMRGSANRKVGREQAEACGKGSGARSDAKDIAGKCRNGRLDPYDCLEEIGQCLANSDSVGTYEDSVPAAAALALLPDIRKALDSGDAEALGRAVQPLLALGEESKPPLNDQGGSPSGYGHGDRPVPVDFPLPNGRIRDVVERTFFLQPAALAFCKVNAVSDGCLRAVSNYEFSQADLETCASGNLRARAVDCLYAVRHVHRKGFMRRAKVRDDVTLFLGRLQEKGENATKARLVLAGLEESLEAAKK